MITLGEDRDEMNFWGSMYPNLSPNDQKLLIENLTLELNDLRKQMGNSDVVSRPGTDA